MEQWKKWSSSGVVDQGLLLQLFTQAKLIGIKRNFALYGIQQEQAFCVK